MSIDSKQPTDRIDAILNELYPDPMHKLEWLNTPHPDLGGRTAISVILEGNAEIVADMLEAAKAGIPS